MERIAISRPALGKEELTAVKGVLNSGRLAQGPKVAEFEERFAKIAGTDHAVAVSNGTVALTLTLRALSLRGRSRVHTTPFTFIATAASIVENRLKPSFSDIERDTFNLDATKVVKALDSSVAALLPVHLYGLPCDMAALTEAAERRKIPIIEDAAQAIGASCNGSPVGSLGTAACFSLYATKNVTTGEGGMITTNDAKLAQRLRILRNQGQVDRYTYSELGGNSRLTEIQAAIGLVQLQRLPKLNQARARNAALLQEALKGLDGIVVPRTPKGRTHVWHQFTLRVRRGQRDGLMRHLDRAGIDSGVYYPQGLHQLSVIEGARRAPLPICEQAALEVLSIPVHPGVGALERRRIVEAVRAFVEPSR